jgi:hypothetical protein
MRGLFQSAKLFAIFLSLNALVAAAESPHKSNPEAGNYQAGSQAAQQTAIQTSIHQAAQRPNLPLTLSQRWAMACPALLAVRNNERLDSFDIWERKPEYIEKEKESLKQWWGVSNREDLLSKLKWVDEGGGHRNLWKEMSEIKTDADAAVFKAKYPKIEQEAFDRKLEIVRKYDKTFGTKGILGWDYCRLIALCRWGV